jgi:DNA polymerase-1
MSLLFVIDAPHALFRSCYANGELEYERRGEVHKTGGVYGFLKMVRAAHRDLSGPAMVVAAWEDPQRNIRSFRRSLYPTYKQKSTAEDEIDYGRIELSQFVREQQKLMAPLLTAIGIPQAFAQCWEADDVLATLCHGLPDHEVIVFSGDKDMMTLVSDRVTVMRPLKEGYELVTPALWTSGHMKLGGCEWKTGHLVSPEQWPQVLALAGDDSDNIPGVLGVGFKTAEKLLREHGDLEGVIRAAAAGQVKRFGEAITAMADQLRLNLKLTTLNGQVDLCWTPPKKDEQEVERRFREMKFASFTSYVDRQSIMDMGTDAW